MKIRARFLLAALLVLAALMGCGNKGDLVLPDAPDEAPAGQ